MAKDKKPRSDSKLDNLPELQELELRDGLLSGWRYEDALSWLISECGVSSSLAALSAFYKKHCRPIVKERRQLAALKAEVIAEDAGLTDWDAASIERLKQMVFEFLDQPDADVKSIEKLFKLTLKTREQDMDARKLDLLEAKAKAAEQASEVLKSDMSQEEQNARLREILK